MASLDKEMTKERLPACDSLVSRKIDGECAILLIDGKECCSVNPGGVVRAGLPFMDEAVELLQQHGYEPYILVEDYEETPFRKHFAATNVFGRVDWPPTIEYAGLPRVRLWAIADRARYLAGQSVLTTSLPQPKRPALIGRSR